ncbi:MAG: 16S rRNA (adenine(1518)-N(6)/adenine(1519)-N(6))-dimethyltransferase RsmA [Acidobacteriia bacterium]|nr:16S rRNA (adenine(1518)-N(6)/adenine(1519)-N(6))-dimethyltransferase RsmA [Terriglobia bacterium]
MARQRLGQHFLADAAWREKIARAIGISRHAAGFAAAPPSQTPWLEIGAGHGEMTEQLLATGFPVTAVELDPPLVAGLQRLAEKFPNLTVVPGDILQLDLAKLLAGRRVRVYGNLPYYITSPILHRLFEHAAQIETIHIVIQLEVAQRLAARPGSRDYGYLSVLTHYFSRPEIALQIPRGAFQPPPEVTSALVSLRLPGAGAALGLQDEPRFLDFVKLCFAQKRKTLVNNLRALAGPELVREALASLDLRRDARAEQLSVEQFAALFRRLIPGEER